MITSMRHRKKASVLMLQSLPGPQVISVALFRFLGRVRQAPSAWARGLVTHVCGLLCVPFLGVLTTFCSEATCKSSAGSVGVSGTLMSQACVAMEKVNSQIKWSPMFALYI